MFKGTACWDTIQATLNLNLEGKDGDLELRLGLKFHFSAEI